MPMSARTLNTSGSYLARCIRVKHHLADDRRRRRLRALLETLDPQARETLRRALIHDQADRDAIASSLMRYRDQNGQAWSDIIDMLMMHPEARRKVVRLLGEIQAS
jgi:hypothetical protein